MNPRGSIKSRRNRLRAASLYHLLLFLVHPWPTHSTYTLLAASLSLTFSPAATTTTMHSALRWTLACLAAGGLVRGIDVELTSSDSIKAASNIIAHDMLALYTGNNTGDNPGNLPPPYYWWEAGAMFMHMVDYNYCSSSLRTTAIRESKTDV